MHVPELRMAVAGLMAGGACGCGLVLLVGVWQLSPSPYAGQTDARQLCGTTPEFSKKRKSTACTTPCEFAYIQNTHRGNTMPFKAERDTPIE